MTPSIIESAVRAAHESCRTYNDARREVVLVVELITGFKEGNQFSVRDIEKEMSKYIWR